MPTGTSVKLTICLGSFRRASNVRRILLPTYWEGHPLRKEYSARATEYTPYMQNQAKQDFEQEHLRFVPEDWGLKRGNADEDFMFLNLGPNHPSAHGAFRVFCSWTVKK